MLGRLGICCRTTGLILWVILWFLIRIVVLPVLILCVLCVAGPIGFLEWLAFGSRHIWSLWTRFSNAAGSLIPEL
jgi:hypothetical protein